MSTDLLRQISENEQDRPGSRCAHTLTAIPALGEEGAPGFIPPRLILFGGATALETNSPVPSSSSFCSSEIPLAGPTSDVHCVDLLSNKWLRLNPFGEAPSPRAAHASTAVGMRIVVQGGIGPAGLSDQDLHILDMSQQTPQWNSVVVHGPGPGPRYGHVMASIGERFLLVIGGNDGQRHLADVWALDTAIQPYHWRNILPEGEGPPPFIYAAASVRLDGLLLLCGGRDSNAVPLSNIYGLARNNDGKWVWASSPIISPSPTRYHHAAVFVNAKLHLLGGAALGGQIIQGITSISVLDTESGLWCDSEVANHLTWRCKHAAAAVGSRIFIYGGLSGGVVLDDLVVVEDSFFVAEKNKGAFGSPIKILPINDNSSDASKPVRLHHRPVVVAAKAVGITRQFSIDEFKNEARRVSFGTPESAKAARKLLDCQLSTNNVSKKVIECLLKPKGWKPPFRRRFFLDCNGIAELCDSAEIIFSTEPSLLMLKAPIKIFGDIHGQFEDLMRFFNEYGSPSTAGDIKYIDYLFLGDYVDRGQHSLETISLLLALKVEYPNNVHLIRGSHETADINALFGFRKECIERMGESDGQWTWLRMNRLFNWLPLAALIENKIICMHGGIGRSINHLEQIENFQRPITMEAVSDILLDLLWSNPRENDSNLDKLMPNARGPDLVRFGHDRVREFCKNNNVQLIVRSHECVMDGFECFVQGQLITFFSATNYCGKVCNAGAMLVVGRDLMVVPKLIHPYGDETDNHIKALL